MTSEFELMPCEPEAVLPTQVSGGARWDGDMSGPRALMLAVLEDAVQCIEEGRWQRRFRTRRLAAEAQAWVWCDRADWPFSFVFFFSSRRRHTRFDCDWSSDVCSSD